MPFTLTMPKLSPTMEEGVIAKWHVSEGDFVEAGGLLFEVSTDKATVEYNALDEGWLRQILISEGEAADINQPVAIFTTEEKESLEGYQVAVPALEIAEEEEAVPTETAPTPKATTAMAQPVFKPIPPLEGEPFKFPTEPIGDRLKASPLAKALAKDQNLDLSTIMGTGPGGRIMKRDLKLAQPGGPVSFTHRTQPSEAPGSYEEIPMTPMRKLIAKRLQESKTFIPHYYVSQEIDAEGLVSMREQLKEGGIKLTYNDFIIRACALALRDHPLVNSGYNSETHSIVLFKTIDISVAVSIDDGLVTPIIRHADYKTLGEISVEVKELAARAKKGKLQTHEYQGGSFTISNLGMYGVTHFQAVINPPQSCILAVGGINDQPVVKDGEIVPGKIMNVTISADHRIVDGALAADFLRTVKHLLEHPALLII
ncbi:MAG: Dihydrolipoyllysine-residue acetyltransferase component of pyruvate dehydrogenase complex [Chlamydiae bacterium]|nr:Dihydrolipoyllysine-residue acetyltransferase component of pyruvate dehydrogenase complex [Chlamydiota bacterium]